MSTRQNISVVVAGSGTIKDITINPGTTVNDILTQLDLTGYHLTMGEGQAPFNEGDNVYTQVKDGDKLFASTDAEAGS